MPWFQVDDSLPANSKIRRLIETNPTQALAAIGLWTLAGASAQAGLTDGVVTDGDLVRLTLDRTKARRLAGVLVDAGLWHATGHSCSHCPPVDRGAYAFHQWFQCGYEPGEAVKIKRAREKEVKNPRITEAVRARDGDECRYCGRTVDWKDRKSDKGGTYDHVLPGLAKGAENLVVACFRCNRAKGQRTPEQAGMTLRPPPRSSQESVEDLSRIYPGDADSRQIFGCSPRADGRAPAHGRAGQGRAGQGGAGQGGAGQGSRQIPETQIEETA